MKNNNTTNVPLEALQNKTKQVIIATKGEQQHIQLKPNHLYEIKLKEGEVLNSDINLIAKKVGDDLQVLLEHNTSIVFDQYFQMCADLSCLVSLPSTQGTYYVVDGQLTTLADGSQVIHAYGDEATLSAIAEAQSVSFAQSFSEVFLASNATAFTYLAPFLSFAGVEAVADGNNNSNSGTGSNNTSTSPPTIVYGPPIVGTNAADRLIGTAGNDNIDGGAGDDTIIGNDGDDWLKGGAGDDILEGDDGDDIIEGGSGDDTIRGLDGDDTIKGGEGDDTIKGGEGDDTIIGGEGDDVIHLHDDQGISTNPPGVDKDTVVYNNILDGIDTVYHFQTGAGADVLDLSALLTYQQGDTITDFISFTPTTSWTELEIDADGNGSGTDVMIYLMSVTGTDLNTMIADGNIVLV